MNLLTNPSFEQGWTDDGPRQIPNGWRFWYATPDLPNELDPDGHEWAAPEMRHLAREHLPEHEHALFFWDDSKYTLKIFAPRWHCAWFRLWQVVDLEPGRYKLTVPFFPDIVGGYTGSVKIPAPDPYSGLMRLYYAGDKSWQTMQPFLEKSARFYHFDVLSMDGGPVGVGVEVMMPFPLAGSCAIFTDAWTLEAVGDEPQPCRGAPRVQYARTYNVLPQNATLEQAVDVLKATYPQRQTIGFSSDDAGIGDLNDRSIVEWMRSAAEQPDYANFYARYYPGIALRFKPLPGQPQPPPPVTSGMLKAGFHLQRPFDGWVDVLRRCVEAGRPMAVVKIVAEQMENIAKIREVSPKTLVVFRAVNPNEPAWFIDTSDHYKALNTSHFAGLFDRACELGFDIIETPINEVIGTHNPDVVKRVVAFEVAYCHWCRERSGGKVAPGTTNPGGGNPDHGAETALLADAARAVLDTDGYLMPHTYFPARPDGNTEIWMDSAQVQYDYHLRPILSWLKTFAELGVDTSRLRFIFGEAGACGAYINVWGLPGGYTSAGAGWRGADCLAGNLARYVALLARYEELCQLYPQIVGWQIFTQGFVAPWDMWQFNAEWHKFLDRVLT